MKHDIACERCRFWDQYNCYRFPQVAPTGARHWCGEFQEAKTAMHIDELIERDRQRREAEGFGHREPILQRKRQTADVSWWEEY